MPDTDDGFDAVLFNAPRDNLFRGFLGQPVELRADTEAGRPSTMFGHFARFEQWNEIESWYEGRFIERLVPGAFAKTFKDIMQGRSRAISQYDHGYDPYFGSSSLGPFEALREEDQGPYYEVPLLDADYNHDRLIPMLGGLTIDGRSFGSVLGASYRFRVRKEEWVDPKKATDWNPERLPERTIREVTFYEAGPVAFPADQMATSGVRSVSLTDHYIERQAARTGQAARAAQRLAQIAGAAAPGTAPADPDEPPQALDGPDCGKTRSRSQRRALALLTLKETPT